MNKMTVSTVSAGALASAMRPIWLPDRSWMTAPPFSGQHEQEGAEEFTEQPAPLVAQIRKVANPARVG